MVGNRDINNREVNPLHPTGLDLGSEVFHMEGSHFMVLDQTQDHGGTPLPDDIEVRGQITIPGSRSCIPLFLTGTERDTYDTREAFMSYLGNLQRMTSTGPV